VCPCNKSFYPTRAPPITIPTIHTFWNLLVFTGNLRTTVIAKIKSTMNFLNERNPAKGMIVRQYDESILLRHMKREYGKILRSILLFKCFLP